MDYKLLRRLLHYEPSSGVFTWKHRSRDLFKSERSFKQWNSGNAGQIAGWNEVRKDGYKVSCISIFGRRYTSHRLAWIYMTGNQPPRAIDHINRNSTDNRWDNLRDGTLINDWNRSLSCKNTSGAVGVDYDYKRHKWKARASVTLLGDKRTIYLGSYDTKDEAACVAREFRRLIGYKDGHGKARPY